MHRWFAGPCWTWPWPHWFFSRRRLRLAWEHLPPERQAAYRAAPADGRAGLTFEERRGRSPSSLARLGSRSSDEFQVELVAVWPHHRGAVPVRAEIIVRHPLPIAIQVHQNRHERIQQFAQALG